MMFIIIPYQLLGLTYLPFFAVDRLGVWDRLARSRLPGVGRKRPVAAGAQIDRTPRAA